MSRRRINDIPDIDRPREKIERLGAGALSDTELLAAIFGRGVKGRDVLEISSSVARKFERNLFEAGYEDLVSMDGIGKTKACQLIAAFELARRHLSPANHRITSPEEVLPVVNGIRDKKQEYFICLTLNGAGELIEKRVITVGLLNYSPVHPREVFADAIADRAASVILVHNHPSGQLEPSGDDVKITRQLIEAGRILGIRVHDHIIVTRSGYLSMRSAGYME